jgi:glutathione S-transferase
MLAELEDCIEGPYAAGEQFTLTDIMVFPESSAESPRKRSMESIFRPNIPTSSSFPSAGTTRRRDTVITVFEFCLNLKFYFFLIAKVNSL